MRLIRGLSRLICIMLVGVTGAAGAQDDAPRWRFLEPGDGLYSPVSPGAAISLDDSMAMIHHLPQVDGWLVTVGFSAPARVTELTSRLVFASGVTASLELRADSLISAYDAQSGAALVSFPITREDVARFQAASHWEIETGQGRVVVPLRGSMKAIAEVIEARARLRAARQEAPPCASPVCR